MTNHFTLSNFLLKPTSLNLKDLSLRANSKKIPQVPGVIILGKALLLSGPIIRVGMGSVSILSSDGSDHEPPPKRKSQLPGVYQRPTVVEPRRRCLENS